MLFFEIIKIILSRIQNFLHTIVKSFVYYTTLFILQLFSNHTIAQDNDLKYLTFPLHIEPPYTYISNGNIVGENVDIAKALARGYGAKAVFLPCPVARCISMIYKGTADIMIGIRKTELRKKYFKYLSSPIKIQTEPLVFFVNSSNNIKVERYEDLYHMRIGIIRGVTYFDKFDFDKNIHKVPLTSHEQMIDMLIKGRIDAFIEREESIMPLIKKLKISSLKIAEYSYNKSVESYIVISKKSSFAHEEKKLSSVLDTLIRNGEIQKIIENNSQK